MKMTERTSGIFFASIGLHPKQDRLKQAVWNRNLEETDPQAGPVEEDQKLYLRPTLAERPLIERAAIRPSLISV
jgi:hypothetical protein